MATTIGRVDFLVDFDGKKLPAKAKQIGREVGNELGDESFRAFNERFQQRFGGFGDGLTPAARRRGSLLGSTLSKALERRANSDLALLGDNLFDGSFGRFKGRLELLSGESDAFGESIKFIRLEFDDLNDSMSSGDAGFANLRDRMDETGGSADGLNDSFVDLDKELKEKRKDTDTLGSSFDGLNKKMRSNQGETNKTSSGWKNLSHNLRQAIVIVAAVAAAGEQIATLGSAAGAGLVLLGSAAISGGAGLAVLVAGLQGVSDKLKLFTEQRELLNILPEDLTNEQLARLEELNIALAKLDPAYASIVRLGGAFKILQDDIESALLTGMSGTIDNLTTRLVPLLSRSLTGIATVLRESIGAELEGLTSNKGLLLLRRVFDTIEKQLPLIVSIISGLAEALAGVFVAAGPSTQKFLDGINNAIERFADWTQSVEGKNQIQEWLENGLKVLKPFADLLGATGKVLSTLVDDDSVERTVKFLENLTGAMEGFITPLLELLGGLDLFGIIAAALDQLGFSLGPVLEALTPLAEMIGTTLKTAIELAVPLFAAMEVVMLPVRILFEALNYLLQKFIDYFQPVIDALGETQGAFEGLSDEIFEGIKPALDDLFDTIVDLLPEPQELARIIREEVIPWLKKFADDLVNRVIPQVSGLITQVEDVVTALGGFNAVFGAVIFAFFSTITTGVTALNTAIAFLTGDVKALIGQFTKLNGVKVNSTIGKGPGNLNSAVGGIFNSGTYRQIGEAGPEAVVPLNRSLTQVDPSVRALSAIAQGLSAPTTTAGGSSISVAPGAISIVGVRDGGQAASAAMDRLVAMAGV